MCCPLVPSPKLTFWLVSIAAWAIVVVGARLRRGRFYATFAAILVGIHTLVGSALAPHTGRLWPVYLYLHLTVYAHFFLLTRPTLRSLPVRVLVGLPASYFSSATFLAFPWAIAAGFGLSPHGFFIPYVVAVLGMIQSLTLRREEVDVTIDRAPVDGIRRFSAAPVRASARPLRIVQITDPHLGPFMPVARLRAICARAVEKNPDLVLLTGDFLTMESQGTADYLADALSPLRALPGKVFACPGNHDHEAPEVVATALARTGAKYLIDDAALVETDAGPVQIVGMDFHFRNRKERLAAVARAHPRIPGALRVVLLHNPGAFRDLPEGEGDLVLSGHTHGGQLGLVSLGFAPTILRLFVDMPDHGLWARGRDRLYVHKGTGHYGFPLRIGVPAEESVLRVHLA